MMTSILRRRLTGGGVPRFYVDATLGNDSNPGTLAAPWKTLAKVNGYTFPTGAQIYLKKGETFKGVSLVVPADYLSFGAYGVGANPIVDATQRFTDWTLDSGAIWKRTDVQTSNVKQVFEDNVRLKYFAAKASMAAGSFSNPAGGVMYVWCSDGGDPNTGHIVDYQEPGAASQGSITYNGHSHLSFDSIDSTKSDTGYLIYKVGVTTATDITITNATCTFNGEQGVYVNGPSNVLVYNCVAHDNLGPGLWQGHGDNIVFDTCTSYNCGKDVSPNGKLYPSASHFPNGILVSALGAHGVVSKCYVHDIYAVAAVMTELSLSDKPSDTLIDRCLIDQSAITGAVQAVKIEGIRTTLSNCVIYGGVNAAAYGVMLNNTPDTPHIYNNTFVSPVGGAHNIQAVTGTGAVIKNNIVARRGTTNKFVNVYPAVRTAGIVFSNNEYYQASGTKIWTWDADYNTLGNWQAASGTDANSLNSDPVFVTPYTNLHLQAGSPCKAHGLAIAGITTDYDGAARADPPSIGAYE
jgi:hypothetical protein